MRLVLRLQCMHTVFSYTATASNDLNNMSRATQYLPMALFPTCQDWDRLAQENASLRILAIRSSPRKRHILLGLDVSKQLCETTHYQKQLIILRVCQTQTHYWQRKPASVKHRHKNAWHVSNKSKRKLHHHGLSMSLLHPELYPHSQPIV